MKQLLFFASMVLLAACGPISPGAVTLDRQMENPNYVLPAAAAPLLFDKGDMMAHSSFSFSEGRAGFDFGFAARPANHFSFMLNGNFSGHNLEATNTDQNGSYNFIRFDVAPGYSTSFNKYVMMECYAGIGYGELDNTHATGGSLLKQSYVFIQPALGLRNTKGTFEAAFLCRLQGMHINIDHQDFYPDAESYTNEQFIKMNNKPDEFLVEPGVLLRFGGKIFKIQAAINYSDNLTVPDLEAKNITGSIGIALKFKRKEKK